MPAIDGSCLCGAVRVTVARMPRKLTQCNCSTCRRSGALLAYYRRKQVTVTGELDEYMRRPRGLRFRRCATCGCFVCWEWKRDAEARMGVNARLLDPEAMANVPISVLDGARSWRVLEKYKKPHLWLSPG